MGPDPPPDRLLRRVTAAAGLFSTAQPAPAPPWQPAPWREPSGAGLRTIGLGENLFVSQPSTCPSEPHTNDEAAMALCVAGYPDGLTALYARHSAACLAHARSILRDGHHAEDAVQEAYLDVWRQAGRYDRRQSSVRSWLVMLTHRKAVDRARSEQRRTTSPLEPSHDWPDPASGPDAQAINAVLGKQLHHGLAGLTPAKREALVLAYWGAYTHREIATLTGAPLGTVKSRMHSATTELIVMLERNGSPLP